MDESSGDPVLILAGAPGTGKTSVARVLARRFELAVHVEGDRFFHFIERGYLEPWKPSSHEQNTVVMQSIAAAAASYADGGYFTIIDAIVSPRWFLEPTRDCLRARDTTPPMRFFALRSARACHGARSAAVASFATPRSSNSSGAISRTSAP
jgi:chloramphenicol 3-O-phosphotransferase